MTELNGIDILCDAAGSDLLLDGPIPASSPHQYQQQPEQTEQPEQKPAKRVKLSGESSPGVPSHVCHICKRVYERADHLTRHLRSHENARPYKCSRCPKRFNRADLLTRHETTHDRDDGANGRPVIRRSDRAAEACVNCAASKAKCDDQKPCGRCRQKNVPCHTSSRRRSVYGSASDGQNMAMSPSDSIDSVPNPGVMFEYNPVTEVDIDRRLSMVSNKAADVDPDFDAPPYVSGQMDTQPALNGMSDDMQFFNPTNGFFQDMDFSAWDLNFDSYTIPHIDVVGPSPQSSTAASSSRPARISRDLSKSHAAFKRSPWLWEPNSRDRQGDGHEGLDMKEESIAHSPAYEKMLALGPSRLKLDSAKRDRLFALVLGQLKNPTKIPSFPSLDLLSYLLQTYFVQADHQIDSHIHYPSFEPSTSQVELIAALIASGAALISVPAIWKFGFGLQEVVRIGLANLFENSNSRTRDLEALQGYMIDLDLGLWSGFKRKMEIAESFLQPLMTMLRRAGTFSAPEDTAALIPFASDPPEVLHSKWRNFIKRESFKRLVLRIFIHDAEASVGLQKNPLMSFTEMTFSLPAARDLWRAPTAAAWREVYLRKQPLPQDTTMPKVCDVMHQVTLLGALEEFIDIDLCYAAILHGYWGQINAYREQIKFQQRGTTTQSSHRNASRSLWLDSQHQELFRDLSEFSVHLDNSTRTARQLLMVAELFMMILHVSPDEIQRFAGKSGEEEARHAAISLEEEWAGSRDARYAVWHAGQVFRCARLMPPASLRGFRAIAVYLASLTLWVYGLHSGPQSGDKNGQDDIHYPPTTTTFGSATATTYVFVDGDENRESRAFLQLDKGIPGLTANGDPLSGAESVSNSSMVLQIARDLLRNNYPVRTEPLPPLVDSLRSLLRDLGTGPAGRASRVASRAVSEDRIRAT